jgi:WD40 repeat protein
VLSPDGASIVSGASDNQLILWDVVTGKPLRDFKKHLGAVTSVAFSPDGKTILSGSLDRTLILWDATSGEPIRTFIGSTDRINAIAFSPDGRTAISGEGSEEIFNNTIERDMILWDISTGKALQHFEGHTATIAAVAFSPDGRTALSGSADAS